MVHSLLLTIPLEILKTKYSPKKIYDSQPLISLNSPPLPYVHNAGYISKAYIRALSRQDSLLS